MWREGCVAGWVEGGEGRAVMKWGCDEVGLCGGVAWRGGMVRRQSCVEERLCLAHQHLFVVLDMNAKG